ncbi:putative uncharacterized protein DDB_G0275317 [Anneissia japonica]|uniref:putative uncharacterized protein DDB_G0275317 n=1 Tax=Anneissia japonica TaxID=1529436 RepID=UPI0014259CB9|nr:putative uncharacterized protein DDB_G0275317 [Anneissia japonica]
MWTFTVTLLSSLMLSHSEEVTREVSKTGGNCCCSISSCCYNAIGSNCNSDPRDYPRDCTEIRDNNDEASSGDYMIHSHDEGEPFRVYCDMDTDGGGWTVNNINNGCSSSNTTNNNNVNNSSSSKSNTNNLATAIYSNIKNKSNSNSVQLQQQ